MGRNDISLSVLVPVYNEQYLVAHSLERLKVLAECAFISHVQVVVVDDGSTDDTPQILDEFALEHASSSTRNGDSNKIQWVFHRSHQNLGKGAAIRTALGFAT